MILPSALTDVIDWRRNFGVKAVYKRYPVRLVLAGSVFLLSWCQFLAGTPQSDRIVGRWISSQGNVIVQVYKDSLTYKGRVEWFDDSDDATKPMNGRKDVNNPDRNLRHRNIIGLVVLQGLTYNPKCKCWENGKIYDVNTGKIWSSTIRLANNDLLNIRGFWHFEFLGRTMSFKRL
jgi:uncharacterized protein (DUF2147 family)